MALFVCHRTDDQHKFLSAPSALATPTLDQSNTFSVCVQGRPIASMTQDVDFHRHVKSSRSEQKFTPTQTSVCFNNSRFAVFFALCRGSLQSDSAQKGSLENLWSSWSCSTMQQKMGCFQHPTGNTLVLVSLMRTFLDDKAHCSVVTRNSFIPEDLHSMR